MGRGRALAFHEAEVCEGIIRRLELRTGATRREVICRERGDTPDDARVEMTFRLGEALYALEHTGIEPFDGFMEIQNRAEVLFDPIRRLVEAALSDFLVPGTTIELHAPTDGLTNRRMPDVRSIQAALAAWVVSTAPTLSAQPYGSYRGHLTKAVPDGVPFEVTLIRFDGAAQLPGRFQMRHTAFGGDQARDARIARACVDKFPKLDRWKQAEGARTILVFEDNDVQLTNQVVVADAFLQFARTRTDVPDETYMVSTCTSPWYGWPILVGGKSYFEFAALPDAAAVHFEVHAGA